ncbi:hypothetical protein COCCADRAFT_90675, partial [Bipolaris zeicola 26-R-13]
RECTIAYLGRLFAPNSIITPSLLNIVVFHSQSTHLSCGFEYSECGGSHM